MQLLVIVRRLLMVGWDVASWCLAFLLLVLLRYNAALTEAEWVSGWLYTASAILLLVVVGFASPIYLSRSRVGSFAEATVLGASVAANSIILAIGFGLAHPAFPPRSHALASPVPALLSSHEQGVASEHPLITRVEVPLSPGEVLSGGDGSEQMGDLLGNQWVVAPGAPPRTAAYETDGDQVAQAVSA